MLHADLRDEGSFPGNSEMNWMLMNLIEDLRVGKPCKRLTGKND